MVKRKNGFKKWLTGNKITAVAVVLLCLSTGGLLLPKSDAATYAISSVNATATNTSSYAVTVKWAGSTPDHWAFRHYASGQTPPTPVQLQNKATTSRTVTGLTCGVTYHFDVAAAGPQGGIQSAWKGDTAVAPCPAVTLSSVVVSGTTLTANWAPGNSFTTSFTAHWRANGGAVQNGALTSARSYRINGICGRIYAVYVTSTMNGQTGTSATRTVSTAACPAPAPAPTPTPAPTPAPKPTTSKPPTSTKAPTPATTTPAPATPSNFAAAVISSKVVTLTWSAVSGTDHYIINRSTDNATWSSLNGSVNGNTTTYEDDTADFNATYYYQILAVGAGGQQSAPAATKVTTQVFKASSNKVTSQDKSVTVLIPSGAIAGDYRCAVAASQNGLINQPASQRMVQGPYDVHCVTSDGKTVSNFAKPLAVTMKLPATASGFTNLTAYRFESGHWTAIKGSTYKQSGQQLTFSLASARTFAAFGTKKGSSLWGIIGLALLVVLVIAALVAAVIWWLRRRGGGGPSYDDYPLIPPAPRASSTGIPTLPPTQQTDPTAEQEFKQALAKPNCTHLDMAQQVTPSSTGCLECERDHTRWTSLRICLTCGHVGCSDDSPQQHALKHFQETGHPLIYDYANPNGNGIGWCYIDKTYI